MEDILRLVNPNCDHATINSRDDQLHGSCLIEVMLFSWSVSIPFSLEFMTRGANSPWLLA